MIGQLEAYGALKLFILRAVTERSRGEEEQGSEGSERGDRWRGGGGNCAYSASMEKSICLLVEIYSCISHVT